MFNSWDAEQWTKYSRNIWRSREESSHCDLKPHIDGEFSFGRWGWRVLTALSNSASAQRPGVLDGSPCFVTLYRIPATVWNTKTAKGQSQTFFMWWWPVTIYINIKLNNPLIFPPRIPFLFRLPCTLTSSSLLDVLISFGNKFAIVSVRKKIHSIASAFVVENSKWY